MPQRLKKQQPSRRGADKICGICGEGFSAGRDTATIVESSIYNGESTASQYTYSVLGGFYDCAWSQF